MPTQFTHSSTTQDHNQKTLLWQLDFFFISSLSLVILLIYSLVRTWHFKRILWISRRAAWEGLEEWQSKCFQGERSGQPWECAARCSRVATALTLHHKTRREHSQIVFARSLGIRSSVQFASLLIIAQIVSHFFPYRCQLVSKIFILILKVSFRKRQTLAEISPFTVNV